MPVGATKATRLATTTVWVMEMAILKINKVWRRRARREGYGFALYPGEFATVHSRSPMPRGEGAPGAFEPPTLSRTEIVLTNYEPTKKKSLTRSVK